MNKNQEKIGILFILSEDPTTVKQGYSMGFDNRTGSNNIYISDMDNLVKT